MEQRGKSCEKPVSIHLIPLFKCTKMEVQKQHGRHTRPSMHINLAKAWLVIIVVSILILPHSVPGGSTSLWFSSTLPYLWETKQMSKQYFHCSEALFFPGLLCKHFHCHQLSWKKKKKKKAGRSSISQNRVERSSPYHQFRLQKKDETGRLACNYLPHPAQAGDQVPGTKGEGKGGRFLR